jgi:hypothetical protein
MLASGLVQLAVREKLQHKRWAAVTSRTGVILSFFVSGRAAASRIGRRKVTRTVAL